LASWRGGATSPPRYRSPDGPVLPFALPRVVFCVDDNYRCQPRPRRAGLALLKPAALAPFLTGDPVEDVLITTADPRALAPNGTLVLQPRGCAELDVGVTLGVLVRGGPSPVVRGYLPVLDFVRRDVPPNQAYLARSFPTHKVVATEVADELDGEAVLTLTIDGVERQHGTTASMIADVDTLITTIGRHYRAEEEWLLLTGSPAGRPADVDSGWPEPGAQIRGEIQGIGTVHATVAPEGA
jgi:2-keto-4-pentenoate hydratase/2-oxohepta-3-ene-1,7-dioic acid hydratase in catechol pathway